MNLNIRSIFLMSQAIGKPSMIPRKGGKIINVASIAGLAGNSADMTMVAYNTSKGAVVNFTRTLAGEWGKYGINVNALAPGFFPSKMTKGTIAAASAPTTWPARAAAAHRRRRRPEGRDAAVRVAAGKHITGQILPIDGGVSAIIARLTRASALDGVSGRHPVRRACSASSCSASSRARPRSRSKLRDGARELVGRRPRRRDDDPARRRDGACRAQPGRGRRGRDLGVVTIEMKTSFMRPGLGRLRRASAAAAPHHVARVLRGLAVRRPKASCSPMRPARSSS